MIARVIFVAALVTSTAANGPSGSYSYGGYGHQMQQQQQYQPNQQQDRWYTEASQASNVAQPSASMPEAGTAPEETEKPPLPEGWSEHYDPNSGQYYYYNAADGTTSWDRPQIPESEGQGATQSESKVEEPVASEQSPTSPSGVAPEPEKQVPSEDIAVGGVSGMAEKTPEEDSSPTPGATEQSSWGGQGQNQYLQDSWSSTQPSRQHTVSQNWGQSNSTDSSAVRGEPEAKKTESDSQPQQTQPPPQQQVPSARWESPQPTKTDEPPSKPEPWGVRKAPEQHHTEPPKQMQAPPSDYASNKGPWGMPKPAENPPPKNIDVPQNQRPPMGQQGPPHASRPSPQQQPGAPQYYQRQYPPHGPHGSYPPGPGQYDPRYGGQNPYGRGYPPQQPPGAGQLVSQDNGPSAVQEALSNTWKGLLGFGSKTKEVVGSARDQVVTSATAAGQSISAKSTSIWQSAKTTVGGVFENNNDSGAQPPYNLSGQPSPPSYPGRPSGPNQGYIPGGPGGRSPPLRPIGAQPEQPGRHGLPPVQQPRYGAPPQNGSFPPPGRQPPAPHQQPQPQSRHPGYPNMQPRRDPPYPQRPIGQERGPMQAQYVGQPTSQQAPPGQYPPQQRPPFSPPSEGLPNGGPGMTQGTPPQEKPSDPWDHPALTGDY